MSILIVTTDPAPFPGMPATGAGLRAWGLAQGLRARGFTVEIAMAQDAAANSPETVRRQVAPFLFRREALTEHIRSRHPSAVVMQHWGLMNRLGDIDCPLAIDLHGPHLLERLYWGSERPERDLEEKLAAFARADFLTCAGPSQRHYFLAFALQCGFDIADPDLLGVIPFSAAPPPEPSPAERRGADPATFLYAGVLLPWQNPGASIDAMLDVLERRAQGRLRFIGGRHPSAGDLSRGHFDQIIARLEKSPRATIEPFRPSEDFERLLEECGVALDLMAPNPERRLAFTSRTVVYLAAGLPVIHNDYSDLSRLIERYQAGWRLDAEDAAGIRSLIETLLDNPEEIAIRSENARRLVRERLSWDRTIDPLAKWCENPTIRPRKERVLNRVAQSDTLRGELGELRGRRLVRLSDFLRRARLRK